ncbi:MAG: NMD3-related protein [Candidatus Thermoplasmatota archaeon]
MFCVECGNERTIYKNGVCVSCYVKTHRFTKGPSVLDMFICAHCGSYKYKNTWISSAFDDMIQRMIYDVFSIEPELKNISIHTQCTQHDKIYTCSVTISGMICETTIIEQHQLTIRIKRLTCDICSRQHGGYYEATIQIRAEKRKILPEELTEIKTTVEHLVQTIVDKGNRALFITDIFEHHGGIDFYLSEKGSAHTIAKKLIELYGGEIKLSSKNIGMQDTRQIYRMTYLVRLPRYKKHDFIGFNHAYYVITSISGSKVHLVDLATGFHKVVDHKDFTHITIYGGRELIHEMIVVSNTKQELQLMDQKTYTLYHLPANPQISHDQKIIKTIRIHDILFVLPK